MTEEQGQAQRDLLEWCRRERNFAANTIPRIEAGHVKTGRQELGQPVVDTTEEYLAHLRRILAEMDILIAVLERDLA